MKNTTTKNLRFTHRRIKIFGFTSFSLLLKGKLNQIQFKIHYAFSGYHIYCVNCALRNSLKMQLIQNFSSEKEEGRDN